MTVDEASALLPPKKRQIFNFIEAHPGCDRNQLLVGAWGDRWAASENLVSVHINGINKVVRPHGWFVASNNRNRGGTLYTVVQA